MGTNTENTLDQHYLFLLPFAKTFYSNITNEQEKKLCDQWLEKLCGERVEGVAEKRNRNTLFAYLLMTLQEGKMSGPFSKPPDVGPLPRARQLFGNVETSESSTSSDDQNIDEEPVEYEQRSGDGRTYVAIRCLPGDRGIYGYVGLTLDKEENSNLKGLVVPCMADPSKLRHIRALDRSTALHRLSENPSERQMEDFYMRNIERKVSGDIEQFYKQLSFEVGEACGRDPTEIEYYEVLLERIDEEIKGAPSADNELLRFLVSRLAQDLKKLPKMQYLFKLTTEQRNLRLLQILRQKLVLRQQEEKRRRVLAEMEEKIGSIGGNDGCCMGREDIATESMWQLAATKPLTESDLDRLSSIYPDNVIAGFLDLLADDRTVILDRGKKRQRKTIEDLRSEVYREVHSGKSKYNEARADYRKWNEILSTVEDMMYETRSKAFDEENEEVDSIEPGKNEALLASMIANIKETKNSVMEEAQRGESLSARIAATNAWKFDSENMEDVIGRDSSWEMKMSIEKTRDEIERCRLLIDKQQKRIEQLRGQLDYQ